MKLLYDVFTLLKIPLKNIWRNRRRTFMTMAGIIVTTFCLILFGGYIRVMEIGMMDNAISKEFGHFQIARPGYFDAAEPTSLKYLMTEEEFREVEEMLYELEEVDFVNLRLHIAGIIGNFKGSTFFAGICGQPDVEILMSPALVKGKPVSEGDPTGIIIGASMAEKLEVDVNDSLLLFFASEGGAQEAINVTVRGIYKGLIKEQENVMIYIPIESAWDLMLERKIHRILVFLQDKENLVPVMTRVKEILAAKGLDLEVRSWEKLAVYYKGIIKMFTGFLIVAAGIFAVIVVFNISNTMYMVITERTREIGTLRAVGNSRFEILRLLMLEGFFMGIIGAVLGTLLAVVLIPVINAFNFQLPPAPGQDEPILIHIVSDVSVISLVILGVISVTFLSSILPSIKAAQMKIVDALRYI